MALVGVELGQEPGPPLTSPLGPSTSIAPGHDHEPGALVHLVLGELLAGRKLDHDRAALGLGVEHLRLARLTSSVEIFQVRIAPLRGCLVLAAATGPTLSSAAW